jgi:autotransporter-associated beta strand protein
MKQNLKKFTTRILTALVASFGLSVANADDWTGTTSTDWNTGSNWSGGTVPTQNAYINNGASGNTATISANISVTPKDIDVRNGSRLDHTAGTAGTSGGSWIFVGQDNSAGTYNLADTSTGAAGLTGFAQGTGSLNATGNLLVGAFGDNRTGTVRVNTAGTLAVSGELFIGDSLNSTGNFSLESGTMTVNNKIFVGNNRGTGTMTMSGGTLTKTGGDETFVGRDAGTGTLTQSGGTVTLNHNLYVGQSSGSTGTYNISGSSVLNVGRDFVIGRESGTGSLNMTGGTITKTGDEKFLVGHNNGVGTVVQSGGTISANNELYIGNENSGARGTYTLSGTGALNVANEVVVGRESGTGILNVDGGTMTTTGNGNMYIGRRNGTGTLNQTAGVISVIKEFGVGTRDDNKIGTGTYNLSGGSLSAANNIFIGKEQGSSGTLNMTGGTMSTSDKLQIGHNQATGVLTQSGGTLNVQNEVYIGNENNASSVGTYTLSGTGALNVGNEVIVGRDNGTGTLNLNGGTVTATKISGGNGSATVNFNGGVLKAKRDEANLIENLDVANVQSGGAKINSNGFNVATSQALTGAGGLEKLGAGSLILSANNTYAGTTTVTGGLLKVNGSVGSVAVSSGGSLGGSGTTGSLLVNGTLTPGNSPGTLNTGSQTWFNGANYNWQIFDATGSAGSGFDLLNISGSLDLSNLTAGGFGINMWSLSGINPDVNGNATNFNAANNYSWILAQAAAGITGFEATDFSIFTSANNGTAGFSNTFDGALSIAVAGNNLVLNYQAVPEPSSAALTLLGLVSTLALARRRR